MSKNDAFCQRCGELNSELEKSKTIILDLRRECQLLKKQLKIYQVANDEQLQGIEQIEFDQYISGESDNNHSADEKYEDAKIWITTNDAAVTTFDSPFSVQRFEIVKCVDVIDSTGYFTKESTFQISEDTTAAKIISTISNAGHLESKLAEEFQCYTCDKTFKTLKILRRHTERQHVEKAISDDRTFECYQCRVPFKSLADTRLHLNKHHIIIRKMKCNICRNRMNHKEFDQHLCFDLQTIQCEYCLLSFKTSACLLKHLDSLHEEKQLYRCEHCPRFFPMALLKEFHTRQHTIIAKTFKCELCPKRYGTKTTLLNHMKIHAMKQSHLCEQCGKKFNSEQRLKIHRVVHEEPKFACSHCPKKFRMKGALDRHSDLHRNIKYVCDICGIKLCSYFARYKHMKKHSRTEADKKHECETCLKRFYRGDALRAHMKSHTQEKPYHCDYCDKVYRHLSDLNKHLRLHLGENIHKCKQCPKDFRLPTELKKHVFEHYKEQKEKKLATPAKTN